MKPTIKTQSTNKLESSTLFGSDPTTTDTLDTNDWIHTQTSGIMVEQDFDQISSSTVDNQNYIYENTEKLTTTKVLSSTTTSTTTITSKGTTTMSTTTTTTTTVNYFSNANTEDFTLKSTTDPGVTSLVTSLNTEPLGDSANWSSTQYGSKIELNPTTSSSVKKTTIKLPTQSSILKTTASTTPITKPTTTTDGLNTDDWNPTQTIETIEQDWDNLISTSAVNYRDHDNTEKLPSTKTVTSTTKPITQLMKTTMITSIATTTTAITTETTATTTRVNHQNYDNTEELVSIETPTSNFSPSTTTFTSASVTTTIKPTKRASIINTVARTTSSTLSSEARLESSTVTVTNVVVPDDKTTEFGTSTLTSFATTDADPNVVDWKSTEKTDITLDWTTTEDPIRKGFSDRSHLR